MAFFEKLKEERKRLGLSQSKLADFGGTTRKSQGEYEKSVSSPKAEYLEKIAAAGVDVQYLITGVRSDMALSPEEKYLLALYREAPPALRKAAIAALASGALAPARQITVGGDNHGVIAGDLAILGEGKREKRRGR